jgi:hypothetical protein
MRFSMPSSCASLVYDIFQCFFWRRLLFICACFMRGFSLYQPGRSPLPCLGRFSGFLCICTRITFGMVLPSLSRRLRSYFVGVLLLF